MFKIRRKCKGIPTAANKTAAPLPSGVRGTGAPNPKEMIDLFMNYKLLQPFT